jgi:acetoin utilization protein AcuC
MHDASAHVVGGTLEAARAVWSGESLHAANISGGLHHAMASSASGFCIYNDPAIAIAWLLAQGASRVAYVDLDVHHGDGVQAAFYDDPRVLTISLHETPSTLFPGTGHATEVGGPGAEGMSVNVALPPGTGDAGWLRAFHAIVPALLHAFQPDVLVTQHGCDSHDVCAGRWVATGGGGYSVVDVVPRSWSHLLAVIVGSPLDPAVSTPKEWLDYVQERTGRSGPRTMTDGHDGAYTDWSRGYHPGSWLDRSIRETRHETFGWHGLDPGY